MKQYFKMPKKQVLGKAKSNVVNLTTNDEVKSSPHTVAMACGFTREGNTYKGIVFVVDRNMFEETLASCKAESEVNPMIFREVLLELIKLGKDNLFSNESRTIILKYLCCFSKVSEICRRLEGQSLGFFLEMETAPFGIIKFSGGTKQDFEEIVDKFNKGKSLFQL